jgi:hypothetical protein
MEIGFAKHAEILKKFKKHRNMVKKYLVFIKESTPLVTTAENLINYEECEYVDSVSGENVDAIAKLRIEDEKKLYKLGSQLGFSSKDLMEIKDEILKKEQKNKVPFWFVFRTTNHHSTIKNYLRNLRGVEEIYLTKNNHILIRGSLDSTESISKFEDELYEKFGNYIDPEKRSVTYFVFRRFYPSVLNENMS